MRHDLVVHIRIFFSFLGALLPRYVKVRVHSAFFFNMSHVAHVCMCTTAQRGSVERVTCEGGRSGGLAMLSETGRVIDVIVRLG